ncbi:MAG: GNAT family N-acetyltransferase [Clostridia bacterium]|nr:GNAT family N-acetyltransferase [Clostridia bacterium]
MELKIKFFEELTTRELYEILRARSEIFLLEQRIVCQDLDRVDYDALHCFLWEGDEVLACLRAYRTEENTVKIGRVLSITHGKGLGSRLMRAALPEIKGKFGCDTVTVNAQTHAEGFYKSFGFVTTSDEFLEEGVPHVAMRLDI